MDALKLIARVRGCSQSRLAELAGVSRQRVSQWFTGKDAHVNVGSILVTNLADQLHVSCDVLLRGIAGMKELKAIQTAFLWDKLYPDLESFLAALVTHNPRAIARSVEVVGLYETAGALGDDVWTMFDQYKKFLPPRKRQALEALCHMRQNLN